MYKIVIYNSLIALEALTQNKLRAILTSLGIICGVASVIAMLAIGRGAQDEILEKMKLLGTNNIIITQLDSENIENNSSSDEESESENGEKKQKFSPGLSLEDSESILITVPGIKSISPEVHIETNVIINQFKKEINLIGIKNSYFNINHFTLSSGKFFSDLHIKNASQVCIIGYGIKAKMFAGADPIGKSIKCGKNWLKIVGVLKERTVSEENLKSLNIRNFNMDIYTPVTTMLLRYANRSSITKSDLANRWNDDDEVVYNQLDKLVVEVEDSEEIVNISEIIARMLERRHFGVIDFKVVVPELLLEQEQSTKRIFNIVLGAIASISLIVGGIGIMNIMLASVLERTKEIGIRRAIGAKQKDIMLQFLIEAVSISLTGGIIGIILGVLFSYLIETFTEISTIVSGVSVFVSFFVSISVGLVFGITPARKAALQDPIDLLRYE